MNRVLIKDGYILSMDPNIGELDVASVLVEDDKIAAVGRDVGHPDAEVIDARGMVVMPGMADTHRHTWQSLLRGVYCDSSIMEFFASLRMLVAPQYSADDVYIANYIGALEALDAGVTTLLDYSHCIHSPEHADAAVGALHEVGLRAVFGYGYAASPGPSAFGGFEERLADSERIASKYCSSPSGLVTMGIAPTEMGLVAWSQHHAELQKASELDATVVMHTGAVWGTPMSHGVREMQHHGLLGEHQVHVHCNSLDADEWRMLADSGGKVSVSPETELQMGMGRPAIRQCIELGIKPTLSCDIVSLNSGDILTQARLGLQFQRCMDNDSLCNADITPGTIDLTCRDALQWATINGVEACGLGGVAGSLTPGKQADIVLIGGSGLNMIPRPEMVGSVVVQANASNVRTVLVAGQVLKRDGNLVGVDLADVKARAEEAQRALFDRVLSTGAPLLPAVPEGYFEMMNPTWEANLAAAWAS